MRFVPQTPEDYFAECLWGEARGEGLCGMQAVAWVIWNRHLRWREDLKGVILGPNQFTSMRSPGPDVEENDPILSQAKTIVTQVMAGAVQDPTNGACYYYNPAIADSSWFVKHIVDDTKNHPLTATIGRHEFFA